MPGPPWSENDVMLAAIASDGLAEAASIQRLTQRAGTVSLRNGFLAIMWSWLGAQQ